MKNYSCVTLHLAFICLRKHGVALVKVFFKFLESNRSNGRKFKGELMWPVDPIAIKSLKFDNEIYLILYSSISVDIFDVLKGTRG